LIRGNNDAQIASCCCAVCAPRLDVLGHDPVGMCGGDFGAFIRKKYEEYGRTIRQLNIKAE
jgi:hypothetical protein